MNRSEIGNRYEDECLKIIPRCPDCESKLVNINDRVSNNFPGYDFYCSNPKCKTVCQVKSSNGNMFSTDNVFYNGGKTKIMKDTAKKHDLRYIWIRYDSYNYDVTDVWMSDKIKLSDIVSTNGRKNCKIYSSWTKIAKKGKVFPGYRR